jgi:hypothetical protein
MDDLDHEIECARCGARFYYELLECPQCGASVYGEEEEDLLEDEPSGWVGEAAAAALGLLAAALLIAAIFLPLRSSLRIPAASTAGLLTLWIGAAAAGFVGGWLGTRFSPSRSSWQGLMGGLFSSGFALLMGYLYFGSLAPLLEQAGLLLAAPLPVLMGWVGARQGRKMVADSAADRLFGPAIREAENYQRLLAICGYDRARAERLIDFESRRDPHAARATLIHQAVQRWERDNR